MTPIEINGHTFLFTGLEPYTRLNGSKTWLNCWSKNCSHPGCKEFWEFKTAASDTPEDYPPGGGTHKDRRFAKVLCKAHTPKVKRKHAPDAYNHQRRVTDAEVAQMRQLYRDGASYQDLALAWPLTPGSIREIISGRRR